MTGDAVPGPPAPQRRGIGRLVIVAAVGAGAVLGYQSLTGGGSHVAAGTGVTPPAVAVAAGGTGVFGASGASGPRGTTGSAAARGPASTSSDGARAQASGPRLVVVIDQPRGVFAQQNRLIMQGAMVALAQLDASGGAGRGARLVSEKLTGLSPAAVQQRLRAAGPGAVLVLPCDSDSQFSLATGAAPYKTLMLAPCDADAKLARSIPTYWPIGAAGNDEAAALTGIVAKFGASTAFVIDTPGLRYAQLMTSYFRQAAAARQFQISGSATVSLAVTDAAVSRAAAAIKRARTPPAAVFTALPPPYVDRLAAGLVRDGVQQPVLGTSAMDTPLTLAKGSASLENALVASYGFLQQDAAASAFLTAYRARFGVPVGSFPGLGFETIRLLGAAVAKAGSTAPAAIEQALGGGIGLTGAALFDRSYRAGADHNPVTEVSVEKISSGSFLPLVTSAPVDAPAP